MYDVSLLKSIIKQKDRPLPTGTRAQSKERNRQKILDSAMVLFRERGFEAATLRDIASGAQLSTGALFANFGDKNEIFLTVVEAENARVIQSMLDAYDDGLDLVNRLHTQLMRGYEGAQANARLIMSAFVMNWSGSHPTLNEIARLSDMVKITILESLKTAQAREELPVSAPVESAAEILEDLCFANLRRAFHSSERPDNLDFHGLSDRLMVQLRLIVAGLKAS